jgi:hypothetical protein
MWGFLTCLNDILVPHLKSIFDLSYARVMLIQFAFFSAYFLVFHPVVKGGKCNRLSENHGGGLLCMAVGAFLVCAGGFFRFFPTVSWERSLYLPLALRACRSQPILTWWCSENQRPLRAA